MKKLCLLTCACLLLVLALVACNKTPEQPHTHTYADAWSFDEDGHWYAATCEHTDEKANTGVHVDEQNDGVCDVCGYGSDHEHTFASEWSNDAENHWHASDCGHDVKDALGAHADENNDDVCDVCGQSGGCEHPVNAEAWLSDAEGHWHSATCTHTVKLDAQAHVDEDNDGACDTCTWSDPAHTHTFKTDYSFDNASHWFDADCGHAVKGSVSAHADANNDGACDTCPWNDGCAHPYSKNWSVNGTHHWHAVTCTHTIAPADQAEHVDENGDGACDVCEYLDHEHTYNTEEWAFDGAGHWHAATCGCALKGSQSAHADSDNNGACDVCDWNDGCLHPLGNEYFSDATHHWHQVTCTHDIPVADRSMHKDRNADGICDFCAYTEQGHTHTFASTLTVDANSHYYASTCGHDGVRKDEAEHEDANFDGKCDVCGGTTSFAQVLDQATSTESANKVSHGSVINTSIYHFEDQEPVVVTESITYEFGQGYLHTFDGTYDRWFTLLDDGSVFGARKINGAYEIEDATPDSMAGYYFVGSFIYYSIEAYGVEALIYNLHAFALENANGSVGEHYDAVQDTYSFDFYYNNGYGSLYCVQVVMDLSADAVIEKATITSNVYSAFEQLPDGVCYLSDDAVVEYEYKLEITQVNGARTAQNNHSPDKFLFDSYDLADEDGNLVGDTLYLDSEQFVYLYFVNPNPVTATPKLDNIVITCTGTENQVYSFISWTGDSIFIKGIQAGTYTLTLTSANLVKELTVVVGAPKLLNMMPKVYYKDASGLFTSKIGKTYTVYAGQTLHFGVMTTPTGAPDSFNAQVSGGTLGSATIRFDNANLKVSTFCAQTPGTYTITMTSTTNSKVKTTLTVTVVEAPSVADILCGAYHAEIYDYNVSMTATTTLQFTFAPSTPGATEGQVTVVRNGAETEVMAYSYLNGQIVLTHVSGEDMKYSLELNTEYGIDVCWMYDSTDRSETLTPGAVR